MHLLLCGESDSVSWVNFEKWIKSLEFGEGSNARHPAIREIKMFDIRLKEEYMPDLVNLLTKFETDGTGTKKKSILRLKKTLNFFHKLFYRLKLIPCKPIQRKKGTYFDKRTLCKIAENNGFNIYVQSIGTMKDRNRWDRDNEAI